MTTFVTGATGHLGANLVHELLERGERLRVMVRANGDVGSLAGLDVERVCCDLSDETQLTEALAGCDKLYHLAAYVSIRARDAARLHEVNVLGTKRLFRAARRANVAKIVHCSSFAAVGSSADGSSTEDHEIDPMATIMAYEQSKALSEVVALREAIDGLDVTIVNPSGLVGPRDFKPSLIGRTIMDFAQGRMFAYVPGAFDFVDVRDVARGTISAMESGRRGQRYLLTGELASVDQILDWLAEDTGRPRPRLRLPSSLVLKAASVTDFVRERFFPRTPERFNAQSIRVLATGKHGDCSKARRELGYSPRPVREAFRDAVQWFRATGRI